MPEVRELTQEERDRAAAEAEKHLAEARKFTAEAEAAEYEAEIARLEMERAQEEAAELPDIRVVSVVSDDDEQWNVRAEYDVEPFAAIGMLVVALAREVALFVMDEPDDDEDGV